MNRLDTVAAKSGWLVWLMLIVSLMPSGCHQPDGKQTAPLAQKPARRPAIIEKPGSSFSDTLRIEGRAAVLFNPDSIQGLKIKAVNEKAVYATITHDCFYQMQNARKVIRQQWPEIQLIEVTSIRYLLFVKADKSTVCIDLNRVNDICGIFMFDPAKNPQLVDMPNIETVLNFYFKG